MTFKAAVRTVAIRHNLAANWINDVIGDALRDTGPVPAGILWRSYHMLEVYFPESSYILALKLLAARPRDRNDIQALCSQLGVKTRDQAQQIVDQYVEPHIQQAQHLSQALAIFFP